MEIYNTVVDFLISNIDDVNSISIKIFSILMIVLVVFYQKKKLMYVVLVVILPALIVLLSYINNVAHIDTIEKNINTVEIQNVDM